MVVLVAGVVSAAPRPLDFGEVVRNVLKMKGISIDKNAKASVQENVGDIWSDCGKWLMSASYSFALSFISPRPPPPYPLPLDPLLLLLLLPHLPHMQEVVEI